MLFRTFDALTTIKIAGQVTEQRWYQQAVLVAFDLGRLGNPIVGQLTPSNACQIAHRWRP